jgi:hypothetical protein
MNKFRSDIKKSTEYFYDEIGRIIKRILKREETNVK